MASENNNLDDYYNLIFRTINQDDLPDVENYVRSLHKKGYFKKLIEEGKFTVDEIKKLPLSKMCEIYFRKGTQFLKNGDIRVFKLTGDYELYLSGKGF